MKERQIIAASKLVRGHSFLYHLPMIAADLSGRIELLAECRGAEALRSVRLGLQSKNSNHYLSVTNAYTQKYDRFSLSK